jgi:hypothetical protein
LVVARGGPKARPACASPRGAATVRAAVRPAGGPAPAKAASPAKDHKTDNFPHVPRSGGSSGNKMNTVLPVYMSK